MLWPRFVLLSSLCEGHVVVTDEIGDGAGNDAGEVSAAFSEYAVGCEEDKHPDEGCRHDGDDRDSAQIDCYTP